MQSFETMGFGSDDLIKESETIMEKAIRYLRKPQTFIICILFCAMTVIGLQFGSMRHELTTLHNQMNQEKKMEKRLEGQMRGVQSELHKVEHEERDLKAKEIQLEKKVEEETWGEQAQHVIHDVEQNPTVQHVSHEVEEEEKKIFEQVSSIGSTILDALQKIQKPGAAQEHHKASLIHNSHNILKPGAHPRTKVDHPKAAAHHTPPVHHNEHHAKAQEHHEKKEETDLKPHKIE